MKTLTLCLALIATTVLSTVPNEVLFSSRRRMLRTCLPFTQCGGKISNHPNDWSKSFPVLALSTAKKGCSNNIKFGKVTFPAGGCPNAAALLAEVNLARSNPTRLAAFIQQNMCHGESHTSTSVAAETINFLLWMATNCKADVKALPHWSCFDKASASAAADNVKQYGKVSCRQISHYASGGDPNKRIAAAAKKDNNQCMWGSGENLVGWTAPKPCIFLVAKWYLDEGIANKGHRRSLINAMAKGVGTAIKTCGTGILGAANLPIGYTC